MVSRAKRAADRRSTSRLVHRFGALALAIALAAVGGSALAQPSAKDRAEARAAWMKGKRLLQQSKQEEAVEAFRRADELEPKAQHKLDLARALLTTNQLLESRVLLQNLSASEDPSEKQAKAAAAKLLADVGPRIPTITVKVSGPAKARVVIDGADATAGEPVDVDPGKHAIEVRADGYEEVKKEIDVPESQAENVAITLVSLQPDKPKESADDAGDGTYVPAGIAFGVGVAGVAVGAIFGILAFQKTGEIEARCGNTCPPNERDDLDEAKTMGTVATVGFVAGGVGLGAGIILLLTTSPVLSGGDDDNKKDADEEGENTSIAPWITPAQIGVSGRFW